VTAPAERQIGTARAEEAVRPRREPTATAGSQIHRSVVSARRRPTHDDPAGPRAGARSTGGIEAYEHGLEEITGRVRQGELAADPGRAGADASPAARIQRSTAPAPPPVLRSAPRRIQRDGVAEWAKEEYRREAPRTLIASVADGKIGSVYFDDGRIRTTHRSGPEESGGRAVTLQFNIDQSAARQAFNTANPGIKGRIERELATREAPGSDAFDKAVSKRYWREFRRWTAHTLDGTDPDALPAWAQAVEGPGTAHDRSTGAAPKNIRLFEIFKDINGRVEGWHPSRGVAARFETNKQVVSVLRAAIQHLEQNNVTGARERNEAFYDFIAHRLPDFVADIRRPAEI
jgi:hypothetical protein